jgi:Xaa-Pro dipeptidase
VIFHLQQEKVYLVVPTVPEDDIFWKGSMPGNSELLNLYDVDQVITETDIPLFLHTVRTELIYVLDHHVDTSHLPPSIPIDYVALSPAVNEARLIKFSWELDIMRRVTYGSSQAHIALMEQCKPGMTEAHLAAVFRWNCALYQIYNQAYLPIVASGPRAATLHYARNNHKIPNSPHTLVLVDAGGENMCYGSDITRTFPASGIFSEEAKTIYSIVLRMQEVNNI